MSQLVSYTFIHNGERVVTQPVPVNLSQDVIMQQAVTRWPELANAQMHMDSNHVITFSLPTATKQ